MAVVCKGRECEEQGSVHDSDWHLRRFEGNYCLWALPLVVTETDGGAASVSRQGR